MTVYGAIAQQPQADPGRITGRVADAAGTAIRGATVILSRPGGETIAIAATTAAGDYALPALPPTGYVLQAFAVGFGPSRLVPVILDSGKDLRQDITMDIGFISSSRNVAVPAGRVTGVLGSAPGGVRGTGVTSTTDNPSRLRVAGNVANSNLLRQSQPVYPPLAKQARVQGAVILDVVIGVDGAIKELKVISGHPLLQQAAIDAVQTWQYRPFIANGQPSETVTTVTVTFALPN